ncbi:transposase [Patescibacteria group bacterium]|nr:transposase [Patescibacteria group bacterium]
MFIKEIKKKNKGYEKIFTSHRLMESYRTEKGPRQRTVLNLGRLEIPEEQFKLLADRIETILSGQTSFLPPEIAEEIEVLARHYAQKIVQKNISAHQSVVCEPEEPPVYETINVNSVKNSRSRTIGAEHVGLSSFAELGFEACLSNLGFSNDRVKLAALAIVGKLVYPASEPDTLLATLQTLQNEEIKVREVTEPEIKKRGITVIMDAGIATENILLCKSSKRLAKESAMLSQYQERFEKGLEDISLSLTKRGGVKHYDKVIERIGRLKEKYSSIGRFYKINTQQSEGKVTQLTWAFEKKKEAEEQFSGLYFLRTTRKDLSEKEMWSLYTMLTRVEESFRCLKDDLNMRPVFHQKENRTDSHLFITVLAYHLLNSIQVKLHETGIAMRWKRIRALLSTHVIITTSMVKKDGGCIHIRGCSEPEPFHRRIYNALKIKLTPVISKLMYM